MTCDATIGTTPTEWGFAPVRCTQVVGLRTYVTTGGIRVAYCPIGGHEQNVRRRFAERETEPVWFHEEQHAEHERIDFDCPLCAKEMDEAYRTYNPGQTYSRAELTEIAADRELVRDEHLDAMTYAKWFGETYGDWPPSKVRREAFAHRGVTAPFLGFEAHGALSPVDRLGRK